MNSAPQEGVASVDAPTGAKDGGRPHPPLNGHMSSSSDSDASDESDTFRPTKSRAESTFGSTSCSRSVSLVSISSGEYEEEESESESETESEIEISSDSASEPPSDCVVVIDDDATPKSKPKQTKKAKKPILPLRTPNFQIFPTFQMRDSAVPLPPFATGIRIPVGGLLPLTVLSLALPIISCSACTCTVAQKESKGPADQVRKADRQGANVRTAAKARKAVPDVRVKPRDKAPVKSEPVDKEEAVRISVLHPNPKKPGSLAWARYEKYQRARSKREYFSFGGSQADWLYDVSRGFVVVK